jgi:hypothetical protein
MIGGGKVAVGKTAVAGDGEGETAVSAVAVVSIQAESKQAKGEPATKIRFKPC